MKKEAIDIIDHESELNEEEWNVYLNTRTEGKIEIKERSLTTIPI